MGHYLSNILVFSLVISCYKSRGFCFRFSCKRWPFTPESSQINKLHLFNSPLCFQDALPRLRIPLTGCSVEDSCEELQGQPCFRLELPKTCHVFSCDSVDLKQRWLTALTIAVTDRSPACPSIGSSGEELIFSGNKENHSWTMSCCVDFKTLGFFLNDWNANMTFRSEKGFLQSGCALYFRNELQ